MDRVLAALLDLLPLPHWTLAIAIVLLLTLRWWLAPFLIRRMVKSPLEVVCEYCEPGKVDIPKELRAYFVTVESGLANLGFRRTPPFRQRVASSHTEMFVQLFERAESADLACVTGVVTRMNEKPTVLKRLEYRTAFGDATQQWTTNLKVREPYPSWPGVTSTRLPRLQDASQLYKVHRSLVAARKGAQAVTTPLPDPIEYQREYERRDRDFKLSRGFAYEDRAQSVMRPTWRGTFALYLSTAPGFKDYFEWRNERAQEETLRQVRRAA